MVEEDSKESSSEMMDVDNGSEEEEIDTSALIKELAEKV